jgi:hypothetical protein
MYISNTAGPNLGRADNYQGLHEVRVLWALIVAMRRPSAASCEPQHTADLPREMVSAEHLDHLALRLDHWCKVLAVFFAQDSIVLRSQGALASYR